MPLAIMLGVRAVRPCMAAGSLVSSGAAIPTGFKLAFNHFISFWYCSEIVVTTTDTYVLVASFALAQIASAGTIYLVIFRFFMGLRGPGQDLASISIHSDTHFKILENRLKIVLVSAAISSAFKEQQQVTSTNRKESTQSGFVLTRTPMVSAT